MYTPRTCQDGNLLPLWTCSVVTPREKSAPGGGDAGDKALFTRDRILSLLADCRFRGEARELLLHFAYAVALAPSSQPTIPPQTANCADHQEHRRESTRQEATDNALLGCSLQCTGVHTEGLPTATTKEAAS